MDDRSGGWVDAVGVLVVVFIFVTIALVAAGGWPWYAKFLEGSAANWVQAIGSIAAILAAGRFVRSQIQANHAALSEAQKAAKLIDDEVRRLRKREFLTVYSNHLRAMDRILNRLPVTEEEATLPRWTTCGAEIYRLRDSLDRLQGIEMLGVAMIRNFNTACFVLSNLTILIEHRLTQPEPFSTAGKKKFQDAVQFLQTGCKDELIKHSTADELANDAAFHLI